MKTAQEVIEERKLQRKGLSQLLATPAGTQLLTELENEFDPDDITGKTVEETYFNLGARHLLRTLKALRKEAQE
jgi:hypothetical protein